MLILPNIRNYEKYSAVAPNRVLLPKIRDDVTVACILNQSMLESLEHECHLIVLTQDYWLSALTDSKPTFFLAQPLDTDEAEHLWAPDSSAYQAVIEQCNALGIPTVYWDTQAPDAFDRHKETALLFDYVFVANAACLPLYQSAKKRMHAYFLPNGIQLLQYGPINTSHFGRKDLMPTRGDLCNLRETVNLHSYTRRLDTILKVLGLTGAQWPGVTILTATNKPDSMETVFANFVRQRYEPKELIVILNNNDLDIEPWKDRARQLGHVTVLRVDEALPLGRCLNEGIDQSCYPFISKFDDDNYYAPNFLTDLMNAFDYAGTEIIGKLTYFCYFEASHILALMCPGMENRYVTFVSGSGLVIKREVFDTIRFGDKPQGSDSVFLRDCLKNGVRMYSADRFNYVYHRQASKAYHTFKISDEALMRSCQYIDHMDDYLGYVMI